MINGTLTRRRLHRLLRLPADADLPDADARLHARARRSARPPRARASSRSSTASRRSSRRHDAPALPDGRGRCRCDGVGLTFAGLATAGAARRRRSRFRPARRSRWSAPWARASRRWSRCSRGSTTSPPDRSRSTAPTSARSSWAACDGAIAVVNDDPFLFSATVHENIAYARPDATLRGGRARRRRRPGRRLHRAPAQGLRHPDRRARADAVRRPAPADRDRPGDPRRPADPDPRRRHLVGRRLDRAGDQAGAARGDDRPDDVRDRPPPVDDRAGRPDRRARGRPPGRPTARTPSCSRARRCTARSSRRACPTRCS